MRTLNSIEVSKISGAIAPHDQLGLWILTGMAAGFALSMKLANQDPAIFALCELGGIALFSSIGMLVI